MNSFMDKIIVINEKERSLYASKNWRMWSPKHTSKKYRWAKTIPSLTTS